MTEPYRYFGLAGENHNHDARYPAGDPTASTDGYVWTYDAAFGGYLPKAPSGGAGAVDSVDGRTGAVTLDDLYKSAGYAPAYSEITGKPTAFNPTAHKTSHATTGADAIAPGDIGAAPALSSNFSAKKTDSQTLSSGIFTRIIFNAEQYDANGEYDPATGLFVPTASGLYLVSAGVLWEPQDVGTRSILRLTEDSGTETAWMWDFTAGSAGVASSIGTTAVNLVGGGQYSVNAWTDMAGGNSTKALFSRTYFSVARLR